MSTFFGDNSSDTEPQAHSFWGMSGWYRVPLGWKVRTNADGSLTASPNEDFSSPTYDVSTNADGVMVFQDLMRTRQEEV